jgi:MoxR-like ATPase
MNDAGGTPPANIVDAVQRVRQSVLATSVGLDRLVERLILALLTGGHVLLEGPPGVAKTRTVKRFASLLGTDFTRIQATPDLMPADLTGTDILQNDGEVRFLPGPLFNHVVLVDEVNRAPPKVQSALLEAMGERQITTGGITRPLEEPFLVAATQNPLEQEGTYPLPEAQIDRFMFKVELGLPDLEQERHILDLVLSEGSDQPTASNSLLDREALQGARRQVADIHVSPPVRDFIVRLVGATRGLGAGGRAAASISQAASPRASIALANGAQARAWLNGRDHVDPSDVETLASDTLAHRILLDFRARAEGAGSRACIEAILSATPRV